MGNQLLKRGITAQDDTFGMPSYYIATQDITTTDIQNVQVSWCTIIGKGGLQYTKMQSIRRVHHDYSCLAWFYSVFFHRIRLLSINCPIEITRDACLNSKFFLKVIHCILCATERGGKFHVSAQSLFAVMKSHSITLYDMCMIGGILFSTLQECLGVEFPCEVRYSWIKVYSALLKNIATEFRNTTPSNATSSLKSRSDSITTEDMVFS